MVRTLLALLVAAIISIASYGTSRAVPIAPLPVAALQTDSGVTDVAYVIHHRWYRWHRGHYWHRWHYWYRPHFWHRHFWRRHFWYRPVYWARPWGWGWGWYRPWGWGGWGWRWW
jgi:hypothetical protein